MSINLITKFWKIIHCRSLNKTRDWWELAHCVAACGRKIKTDMEYLKMGHSIYQRSDAANRSTLSIAKNGYTFNTKTTAHNTSQIYFRRHEQGYRWIDQGNEIWWLPRDRWAWPTSLRRAICWFIWVTCWSGVSEGWNFVTLGKILDQSWLRRKK